MTTGTSGLKKINFSDKDKKKMEIIARDNFLVLELSSI